MNSILTNSPPVTLYDLCDPTAAKEEDFTADVIRVISHLYPGFHVFKFCPDVMHEGAVWQPDMAIVDKDHKFWFVVEVETAAHHLEKHVIPQVTAFREGDFAPNSPALLAKGMNLPVAQAETLIAYVPRDVLVISNSVDSNWKQKLGSIGVQFMAIEAYKNRVTAQTAHRVDGDLIPAIRSLGFGQVQAANRVIKTQVSSFWESKQYTISGPAGVANWECVVESSTAWLLKIAGIVEFNDGAYVQFLQRLDGSIVVRSLYA